jgi:hypothetical protein
MSRFEIESALGLKHLPHLRSSNHIKEMILLSMILLKASTSSRRSRAARRRIALSHSVLRTFSNF